MMSETGDVESRKEGAIARTETTADQNGEAGKQKPADEMHCLVVGNLMEVLECNICTDIIRPPVQMCEKGHSLCLNCRNSSELWGVTCGYCGSPFSTARNYTLENILNTCSVPCEFQKFGCPAIVLLATYSEHVNICSKNPNPTPDPASRPYPLRTSSNSSSVISSPTISIPELHHGRSRTNNQGFPISGRNVPSGSSTRYSSHPRAGVSVIQIAPSDRASLISYSSEWPALEHEESLNLEAFNTLDRSRRRNAIVPCGGPPRHMQEHESGSLHRRSQRVPESSRSTNGNTTPTVSHSTGYFYPSTPTRGSRASSSTSAFPENPLNLALTSPSSSNSTNTRRQGPNLYSPAIPTVRSHHYHHLSTTSPATSSNLASSSSSSNNGGTPIVQTPPGFQPYRRSTSTGHPGTSNNNNTSSYYNNYGYSPIYNGNAMIPVATMIPSYSMYAQVQSHALTPHIVYSSPVTLTSNNNNNNSSPPFPQSNIVSPRVPQQPYGSFRSISSTETQQQQQQEQNDPSASSPASIWHSIVNNLTNIKSDSQASNNTTTTSNNNSSNSSNLNNYESLSRELSLSRLARASEREQEAPASSSSWANNNNNTTTTTTKNSPNSYASVVANSPPTNNTEYYSNLSSPCLTWTRHENVGEIEARRRKRSSREQSTNRAETETGSVAAEHSSSLPMELSNNVIGSSLDQEPPLTSASTTSRYHSLFYSSTNNIIPGQDSSALIPSPVTNMEEPEQSSSSGTQGNSSNSNNDNIIRNYDRSLDMDLSGDITYYLPSYFSPCNNCT